MTGAMRRWLPVAAAIALLVTVPYTVDSTEVAVVTRFGKPVAVITEPGLRLKWPWEVRITFDRRLQTTAPPPYETLTRDKKNLLVDAFIAWRVADPQRFLQTVGSMAAAETHLASVLRSEMANAISTHDLSDLVSTDAARLQTDAITRRVTEGCRATALAQYGVEVADVRLRRINLPEQNKASVFERMRAERDRIARQYRAEGEEIATRIRATADRERTQILAAGYEKAEAIKGAGDAESMRIYAEAFNRDPNFYRLVRTLEAYRKFLNDKTTVVLSSESELLRLLTRGQPGGGR